MKLFRQTILTFVITLILPLSAAAESWLVPVGTVIGLQLHDGSVTVAAFDDILGSEAKDAGLQIGDVILTANGQKICCAGDIRKAAGACRELSLCIRRGSKQCSITLHPKDTEDGPRLGIYLRQGIAGIGTVTWYNPDSGCFAALGHGVNDTSGTLLQMTEGTAFGARLQAVCKGESGHPGQLKGCPDDDGLQGTLHRNTPQGVFGTVPYAFPGKAVPTAQREQLHTGDAVIRCTVCSGAPRDYSVKILKVYPTARKDGRDLLLKVTDPRLLEATGGIVQGMSGSPILQDGRLVGAVTHVLVNDPTVGYGIFIQNMLDAAA